MPVASGQLPVKSRDFRYLLWQCRNPSKHYNILNAYFTSPSEDSDTLRTGSALTSS
ncbi:hypothetical protein SBA1_340027 [Candidatus Sulfotelmatobacter kueseliae]|uniref:Uncharacterized protein n=1 Tax=Candidatus Sulfotelmatobacter kueseliae TaxID=2042962 RepID=A0A2U3KMW6_9BACT|nr:hypothetical protein SBA1_340027 [Candidatus Sulfotelmatobacter kueseliae]